MNKLLLIIFFILTISPIKAETIKYFCNGESNQFFITFDTKKKIIITGNGKPNKFWTEANYTFWQSANDHTVYEYTFKKSYNKLSGILKVKSHHLITSKDEWYDYKCQITEAN